MASTVFRPKRKHAQVSQRNNGAADADWYTVRPPPSYLLSERPGAEGDGEEEEKAEEPPGLGLAEARAAEAAAVGTINAAIQAPPPTFLKPETFEDLKTFINDTITQQLKRQRETIEEDHWTSQGGGAGGGGGGGRGGDDEGSQSLRYNLTTIKKQSHLYLFAKVVAGYAGMSEVNSPVLFDIDELKQDFGRKVKPHTYSGIFLAAMADTQDDLTQMCDQNKTRVILFDKEIIGSPSHPLYTHFARLTGFYVKCLVSNQAKAVRTIRQQIEMGSMRRELLSRIRKVVKRTKRTYEPTIDRLY